MAAHSAALLVAQAVPMVRPVQAHHVQRTVISDMAVHRQMDGVRILYVCADV